MIRPPWESEPRPSRLSLHEYPDRLVLVQDDEIVAVARQRGSLGWLIKGNNLCWLDSRGQKPVMGGRSKYLFEYVWADDRRAAREFLQKV